MTTQIKTGKRGILPSRRMIVLGITLLVVLGVGSTLFTLVYLGKGTETLRRTIPGKGMSIATSTTVKKPTSTAQPDSSFSFTAAGDYGQTTYTTENLQKIKQLYDSHQIKIGANF